MSACAAVPMDNNSGTGNDDGRREAACVMNSAGIALRDAKLAAVTRAEKLEVASSRFDAAARSGNLKAARQARAKLDIERVLKADADKAVVKAEAVLEEKRQVYARMRKEHPHFEEKRYPIPHVETPSKREAAGEGLPPYTHNDTAPAAAAAAAAAAANRGAGMGRYLIEREAAKEAMMEAMWPSLEAQYAATAIAERAANSDVRARGDSQPKQAQALASVNSDVRARDVCATDAERAAPTESVSAAVAKEGERFAPWLSSDPEVRSDARAAIGKAMQKAGEREMAKGGGSVTVTALAAAMQEAADKACERAMLQSLGCFVVDDDDDDDDEPASASASAAVEAPAPAPSNTDALPSWVSSTVVSIEAPCEGRVVIVKSVADPDESLVDAMSRIERTSIGGDSKVYTGVCSGSSIIGALLGHSGTFKSLATPGRALVRVIYESNSARDATAALEHLEHCMTKNKRNHERAPCDGRGVWYTHNTKFFVFVVEIRKDDQQPSAADDVYARATEANRIAAGARRPDEGVVFLGKEAADPGESVLDAAIRIEDWANIGLCGSPSNSKVYIGVCSGPDSGTAMKLYVDEFKAMGGRTQMIAIYESDTERDATAARNHLERHMIKNKRNHARSITRGIFSPGDTTKYFVFVALRDRA